MTCIRFLDDCGHFSFLYCVSVSVCAYFGINKCHCFAPPVIPVRECEDKNPDCPDGSKCVPSNSGDDVWWCKCPNDLDLIHDKCISELYFIRHLSILDAWLFICILFHSSTHVSQILVKLKASARMVNVYEHKVNPLVNSAGEEKCLCVSFNLTYWFDSTARPRCNANWTSSTADQQDCNLRAPKYCKYFPLPLPFKWITRLRQSDTWSMLKEDNEIHCKRWNDHRTLSQPIDTCNVDSTREWFVFYLIHRSLLDVTFHVQCHFERERKRK